MSRCEVRQWVMHEQFARCGSRPVIQSVESAETEKAFQLKSCNLGIFKLRINFYILWLSNFTCSELVFVRTLSDKTHSTDSKAPSSLLLALSDLIAHAIRLWTS